MPRFSAHTPHDHSASERIGVLVTNLGTPDAPTAGAVRRYLAEFLADPRVIEVPRWVWRLILHGVILRIRPRRSARAYASASADRSSSRCTSLTGVTPAVRIGSVHPTAGRLQRVRNVAMRSRSSRKWTALMGVVPGRIGWSVKVIEAVTDTANCCIALAPPVSVAVTVTVVMPTDTGVTVARDPATIAVATAGADDAARYVSGSPSGSRKAPATSTTAGVPPTRSVNGASAPAAVGGRFPGGSTVTVKDCVALKPPGSVAVTRTVDVPAASGATVTVLPSSVTDATPAAVDVAP